jgi:multidrug efflux pump subunit AcrA (membrane-fusion protein)
VVFAGVKKVFVLDGKKVKETVVDTGVVQGKMIEILSGINPGDKVAVSNLSRLANGVAIREHPAEMP